MNECSKCTAERKFAAAEWKGRREKRKKGWMGEGREERRSLLE